MTPDPLTPEHTLHIGVLDDLRKLPHNLIGYNTVHCETEAEWLVWLDDVEDCSVVVVLDHDLGGEQFGMENSRAGITEMIQRHNDGRINIVVAYVVTMNPAGQKWISSELENADIDFDIDVGGRSLKMVVPDGW